VPVIVFAVSVGDWGSRELLRGDVLQTAQIDTINSTLPGIFPMAKGRTPQCLQK
jgi:hypothetical protein